jgi:hypothetical protein
MAGHGKTGKTLGTGQNELLREGVEPWPAFAEPGEEVGAGRRVTAAGHSSEDNRRGGAGMLLAEPLEVTLRVARVLLLTLLLADAGLAES